MEIKLEIVITVETGTVREEKNIKERLYSNILREIMSSGKVKDNEPEYKVTQVSRV